MELLDALKNRYSVRKYDAAEPTREQIEAVLEAGRLAPTSRNSQSQRIYVVRGAENLAKIDEATPFRFGAPVCLIVGYSMTETSNHTDIKADEPWCFGDVDVASAITHMLLAATATGLGTCWLGAYSEESLRNSFGIPEDVVVRAIIDLGIPAEDCKPAHLHTNRRPLDETVTWL